MKLVTFEAGGVTSYGIWRDNGIVDLGRRLGHRLPTLAALIAAGEVPAAAEHAKAAPDHAHDAVRLLKPLHTFGKCFCVGVNYPDRNAEYKDNTDLPKYPSLFIRFPGEFRWSGRGADPAAGKPSARLRG